MHFSGAWFLEAFVKRKCTLPFFLLPGEQQALLRFEVGGKTGALGEVVKVGREKQKARLRLSRFGWLCTAGFAAGGTDFDEIWSYGLHENRYSQVVNYMIYQAFFEFIHPRSERSRLLRCRSYVSYASDSEFFDTIVHHHGMLHSGRHSGLFFCVLRVCRDP